MIKISIHVFVILLSVFQGIAQQSLSLSGGNYRILFEAQRDYLYKVYYQKVGSADELINGRDHIPYYYQSKLKPILFIDKVHSASIVFNGREYNNIKLDYDTYLDEVIYSDTTRLINNRIYSIALNKDPVENFILIFGDDTLLFRHLRSGDDTDFNLPDGFYEAVYEGKSRYIIKHRSSVYEKDGSDQYFYTPENYITVGEAYSRVRSSRALLKLFGDKSDKIRKFIRSYNFDIRQADKRQIVNVLKYYDSLITAEK